MPTDDPSNNPFVKFKRHVDNHIGATWNGIVSLSSSATHEFDVPKRSETSAEKPLQREQSLTVPQQSQLSNQPTPQPQKMDWRSLDWRQGGLWHHFAAHSPYSPLNLQHLPQPVPQGVPEGVDPYTFTFEDAFEDLLADASGQKMIDLRRRSEMRDLINQMFPRGEPSFFWLRRLHAQGLLQNSGYFGREESPVYEWQRPRTAEEWVEKRRQAVQDTWQERENSSAETVEDKAEDKGEKFSWKDWLDKDIVINPNDMIRRADRAIKNFAKAIDDMGKSEPAQPSEKPVNEAETTEDKGPETEGDLFSTVSSAIAEADKSLSTFMKSFSNSSFKSNFSTSFSKSESFHNGEDENEDEGKTVQNVEEHVDMFGNLHTKTEIKRLNARGEEIGREVHYAVRSVSSSQKPEEQTQQDAENQVKNAPNTRPTGWFWK